MKLGQWQSQERARDVTEISGIAGYAEVTKSDIDF